MIRLYLLQMCVLYTVSRSDTLENNRPAFSAIKLGKGVKNQLHTYPLKSQHDQTIDWKRYNYVVVANEGSGEEAEIWGQRIAKNIGIERDEIGAIVAVPKILTKAPGGKRLVINRIRHVQDRIPVFIDWNGSFSNINNIKNYPTILFIRSKKDRVTEVCRVSGEYNDQVWAKLCKATT